MSRRLAQSVTVVAVARSVRRVVVVKRPSFNDQIAPGERATFALVAMCWLPTLSVTTYWYM